MRLSRTAWVALSGAVWFVVGISLLTVGMRLIVFKAQLDIQETSSLIARFSPMAGGREEAALVLVMGALLIGFIKGRFALGKAVRRVTARLTALVEPISIGQIYGKGSLFLIGGMILLGQLMRRVGLADEIRGVIDVAIGSALINGAALYFRAALTLRRQKNI